MFPCVFLSFLHVSEALAHPEEDVLGGVEACSIDAGSVRRRALALDAAGKAGDGALDRLGVCVALAACHRVRHYKVYGTLCRSTDLVRREISILVNSACQL